MKSPFHRDRRQNRAYQSLGGGQTESSCFMCAERHPDLTSPDCEHFRLILRVRISPLLLLIGPHSTTGAPQVQPQATPFPYVSQGSLQSPVHTVPHGGQARAFRAKVVPKVQKPPLCHGWGCHFCLRSCRHPWWHWEEEGLLGAPDHLCASSSSFFFSILFLLLLLFLSLAFLTAWPNPGIAFLGNVPSPSLFEPAMFCLYP